MIELDDDTRDALAETFNLALGHAALHFSELLQEEVEISVPHVALIPGAELLPRITAATGLQDGTRLVRLAQRFRSRQGDIQTQALLLFAEPGCLRMLARLLHQPVDTPLGELERDALGEVANVILNSCMNRLAEVFDRAMTGSLPQIGTGDAAQLLAQDSVAQAQVLWAGVGMKLADQQVQAQVVFVMDLPSLKLAVQQVRSYFGMLSETT
jgi:chemotaxis protein CheY-P-specific phosphatase CheC